MDDAVKQRSRLFVAFEIRQESHIDLDHVKLIVLQHVQRRIPASEIIQPEGVAQLLNAVDRCVQVNEIVRQGTLCHFDVDQFLGDAVIGHQVFQLLNCVHQLKVQSGEVQRYREDRLSGIHRRPQILADACEDRLIQLMDQAIFFQHGDKLVGSQQSVCRIDPSGQGLAATQLLAVRPYDRLVKRYDPTVLNGIVDVVDDVQALAKRLAHFFIVFGIDRLEAILDHMGRVAGSVDRHARILFLIGQMVAAAVDTHEDVGVIGMYQAIQLVQPFLQVLGLGQYSEVIVGLPCTKGVVENFGDIASDGDQEGIAGFKASLIIERFEVMHIKEQEYMFGNRLREICDLFYGQINKIVVVFHTGQRIFLSAFLQRLGFSCLIQPAVIDGKTDCGQRNQKRDVVYGVAGDVCLKDAADHYLLAVEGHAVLEGKQNAVERAEAGNEDQNRNVGTVDQQTANVNDHCQITNNLFSVPEVAV